MIDRAVSIANPARHFVTIATLLVRGASLPEIRAPLSILAVSGVAILMLAIRQYSKRTA